MLLPKLVRDELALHRLMSEARRRASALLPVFTRTGPDATALSADQKETSRHVD